MAHSKRSPTRAEKVERTPSLKCSNYIAAIDFGTSSVSLAYITPLNRGIQLLKFNSKHRRVPNTILIHVNHTDQCIVKGIGYTAQTDYSTLEARRQTSSHLYFERIKKTFNDESTNRDTTVPSFTGGNYYLIEVIAFIIKQLKDMLLYQLEDQNLKTTDFDWVITVPAIWKARARRMMREAAYLAGLTSDHGGITMFTDTSRGTLPRPLEVNPHKLTLALEPEAAAIYAHYWNLQQTVWSQPKPLHLEDFLSRLKDIHSLILQIQKQTQKQPQVEQSYTDQLLSHLLQHIHQNIQLCGLPKEQTEVIQTLANTSQLLLAATHLRKVSLQEQLTQLVQVAKTQQQLETTQQQLENTQQQLENTQQQLENTQQQLENIHQQLENIHLQLNDLLIKSTKGVSQQSASQILQQGHGQLDKYIIVDIGGSKADITLCAEKDETLHVELDKHQIGHPGGISINEFFKIKIVSHALAEKPKETTESNFHFHAAINILCYQKFEEEKKKFGQSSQSLASRNDDCKIVLDQSLPELLDKQLQLGFKTNQEGKVILQVKFNDLEEIFQQTLLSTIQRVQQLLSDKKIQTVYLVGEFGGCDFAKKRFENAIHSIDSNMQIVCLEEADLAVTIGAVLWRQDPDIIQSRIADATYWIKTTNVLVLDEDKKKFNIKEKDVIVHKDDKIRKTSYVKSLIPKSDQDTMIILIYATIPQDSIHCKEEIKGQREIEIGQLVIDIPNHANLPRKERIVNISFDFRDTDILASATYRITGKTVMTICDFL